eukprot:627931_1
MATLSDCALLLLFERLLGLLLNPGAPSPYHTYAQYNQCTISSVRPLNVRSRDLFPHFDKHQYELDLFGAGYHGLNTNNLISEWGDIAEHFEASSLQIDGHPVMEEWETPYMQEFAKVTCNQKENCNNKRVLEIGFGLGISAKAIFEELNKGTNNTHYVIELNNNVFQRLQEHAQKVSNINVDIVPCHGSSYEQIEKFEDNYLDGVFYDTYPMSKEDQHIHQFAFLKEARKKVKVGGRVTYCNLTSFGVLKKDGNQWINVFHETQLPYLIDQCGWHQDEIDFVVFELPPSAVQQRRDQNCQYYHHDTCIIPILTKKRA